MYLTINRKVLTEAVRFSAVGKMYPITEHVRLKATADSLTIDGYDGELYTSYSLPCSIEEEGVVLVSKKLLSDALKKIKDANIVIKADGEALYVNGIKLPAFEEGLEEFYLMDFKEEASFIIPSDVISNIEKVRYAVSKDTGRFNLAGVHFRNSDIVATDGHRLALYTLKDITFETITLPVKLIDLLLKMKIKKDIKVLFNSERMCVAFDGFKVYAYLSDGIFPNYRDVIPSDNENTVIIKANKEALIDTIERVIIGDDRKDKPIQIDIINNILRVKTSGGYKTDYYSEAEMPIEVLRGSELKVGFNAKYILDAIRPIQGDVVIKFIDANSQITVLDTFDDGYLALVMPMTIG